MDVILGADGGNTKTELVVASLDGELISYLRGPGSNSHGPGGAEGCVEVLAGLVSRADLDAPADAAAYFLCGADVPADVAALEAALAPRGWSASTVVDNDTFALLRAGTDAPDAIAVVCGAGINCVGRASDGRVARYPSLGWETGDWGGAEALGREALSLAARAKDGRGEPTALVGLIQAHFGMCVEGLGEAIHYGRMPSTRLGELAPGIVAADDAAARALVGRLADELVLLAERALRDLGLRQADVVLGGGMLREGGTLVDRVAARLPVGARPVVLRDPPVLGAAGATNGAHARLRGAFREGAVPDAG